MFTSVAALFPVELATAIARHLYIVAPTDHVSKAIALMQIGQTSCSQIWEQETGLHRFLTQARSCVLVLDVDRLVGIFTERDLLRLYASGQNPATVAIAEVMSSPVLTLNHAEFTDVFVALDLFQRYPIHHLPLVDDQHRVVGLLTPDSLWQWLLQERSRQMQAQGEGEHLQTQLAPTVQLAEQQQAEIQLQNLYVQLDDHHAELEKTNQRLQQILDQLTSQEADLRDRDLQQDAERVHYRDLLKFFQHSDRHPLESEQNRLLALLEASTDYILMTDAEGDTIWNNTQLKRLRGLTDEAVIQQRPADYYPQAAIQVLEQEAIPAAIANGSWIGDNLLLDAEGQEIPVSQLLLAHKSPQGDVEFFSFIMRDMRVHKEYEQRLERTNAELLRATRLKDEFLATMSHELRTPLNAILGMSEGLQEEVFGALNDYQKKVISTIEHSGRHLLDLINDILEVSKIAAGKLTLDISPVSVTHLCTSSLVFVKQQALKKQIQLTTTLPTDLGHISVDERRLRQVLINLLTNAVKFTPTGGRVNIESQL